MNFERYENNLSFESNFTLYCAVWEKWEGFFLKNHDFLRIYLVILEKVLKLKLFLEQL